MSATGDGPPSPPIRMLDLRSGGWVLLAAGLLMLATLAWRLSVILPSLSSGAAIGDGRNVASYGFDMSTCLVRPELIMAGGPEMRKDGLPAMVDPPVISAADMPEHSKLAGVRKMVSADRVIGVVVGGVARAYPLWVATLFSMGPPPPLPFENCGPDPTPSELTCDEFSCP